MNISGSPSPRRDIITPSTTNEIASPSSSLRGLVVTSPSIVENNPTPSSNIIIDNTELTLVICIIGSLVLITIIVILIIRKRKKGGIHPCPTNESPKKKKRDSHNRPRDYIIEQLSN